MTPEMKLEQLGFELPPVAKPVGAYVPAVRTGDLIFTAGQIPLKDGRLTAEGKVPSDVSLPDAQGAARQCVLNALSAVRSLTGSLEAVVRVVRVNVFVNSSAGYTAQAKVANGASELLLELFGESGRHTRCAVGVAELPMNAPVELDMVIEVA